MLKLQAHAGGHQVCSQYCTGVARSEALTYSIFWVVTRHELVIFTRRFGTTFRSVLYLVAMQCKKNGILRGYDDGGGGGGDDEDDAQLCSLAGL